MANKKFEITLDHHPAGKAWIAKLTGVDPKYGFKREFIRSSYTKYDSKRRPIKSDWALSDGFYESNEQVSWKRVSRRYFVVENGEARYIDPAELNKLFRNLELPKNNKKRQEQLEKLKLVNGYRLKHGYTIVKRKRKG
jgi:hypothetical protein